jgi:elongation factor 1-beta
MTSLATIAVLESHLADKSFIEGILASKLIPGYVASQADAVVYASYKSSAPKSETHPHAARWFKHIASYVNPAAFPGTKQAIDAIKTSAPAPDADDDEEIDLFGSDDEEEDAENERIKAERVAEYNKKKATSM